MSSPFKTAEFKKLFSEWNTILIETGHKEIEDFTLQDPLLLEWHNYEFKNLDIDSFNAQRIYYEKARHLLHTYEFKSIMHRRIWELHSEGASIRMIAQTINLKKYKKSTIFKILKTIRKEIQ